MGLRTTLLLLVVVGALVSVLMFTREKPIEQGSVSVSLLASHRLSSATKIRWQFADMAPVELQRRPGGPFMLTFPIDDLASPSYLRNIATTYDSAMIGETPLPDTPENRDKTGLAKPQLVVDVEFEDGTSQHLEFGAEGPLGTDVFVRRDGRIYRGGLALLTAMQVNLEDLRERLVFHTPAPVAAELVVDRKLPVGGREVLRMTRANDGWELHEPAAARASTAAAEAFLAHVLALRIDVFPDGPLALPEGEPDVVLTVRGGPREEHVELWLDAEGNMVGHLKDRRIYFKSLNAQYVQAFLVDIDALRSRVLLPMLDFYREVVTVLVEQGADQPRLVLHRDTAEAPWGLREPLACDVDPTAVNELLTAINNLRALRFLPAGSDLAKFGLAKGALAVAVQGISDTKPSTVLLGGTAKEDTLDVVYATRTDGMSEIVTVPQGPVELIRRPWNEYVSLRVLQLTEAVSRLDLRRADGRARRFVYGAGAWSDAAGGAIRVGEVEDTADRLRDLTGKRALLARTFVGRAPDWSVQLGRAADPDDGTGFATLDVWDENDRPLLVRKRVGTENLGELVYELKPTDSRNLRELWQ